MGKDGTCCCSYCEGYAIDRALSTLAEWFRGPVQTDEWDEDHAFDPDHLADYIERFDVDEGTDLQES